MAAKRIALIAHDNMKPIIIEWCKENKELLSHHFLCGTGTTAAKINEVTGLPVKAYLSGPLGVTSKSAHVLQLEKLTLLFSSPTLLPHSPTTLMLKHF